MLRSSIFDAGSELGCTSFSAFFSISSLVQNDHGARQLRESYKKAQRSLRVTGEVLSLAEQKAELNRYFAHFIREFEKEIFNKDIEVTIGEPQYSKEEMAEFDAEDGGPSKLIKEIEENANSSENVCEAQVREMLQRLSRIETEKQGDPLAGVF